MEKVCQKCGKQYQLNKQYSSKQVERSKFCSRECQYRGAIRKTVPDYGEKRQLKCNKCGVVKKSSEFYPHKRKPDAKAKAYPKCKDCNIRYLREMRWALKMKVIEEYGGKCKCCGEDEPKFLAIDHIYNDGKAHRLELKENNGGMALYRWLRNNGFPKEKYQLLCHNCNLAKQFWKKCPHQK